MRKALVEKRKKDNKGFSLVELIVVVLIIAIISVSLAPQVMKWVGTSKENVDENSASLIKSAVTTAVAEYMAQEVGSPTADFNINGAEIASSSLGNAHKQITEVMNGEWPSTKNTNTGFNVHIAADGKVTVTYGPSVTPVATTTVTPTP